VVVTSGKKEEAASVLEQETFKKYIPSEAKVENDGSSWIAAKIQVRYNITIYNMYIYVIFTTSTLLRNLVVNTPFGVEGTPVRKVTFTFFKFTF
jgi:hypothetical protein